MTILQPNQVVLSTNLLFKLDVLLPLVTGDLLQNTVDVTSVVTGNIYRILKKLPVTKGRKTSSLNDKFVERTT